jgi:transcriptional regulator with XRE-family HTH domain
MTLAQDPAALRRQLLRELKRFRADAGLTQKDVANAMDWSASKVIRIESGNVTISTNDLRALLAYYGVKDGVVVSDLVQMARDSKRQSFAEYRDIIPASGIQYYQYEASAWIIRQFEPLLIPGLLQIEDYTRAIMKLYDLPETHFERLINARADRQELLEREQPPEMFFILDENVIRRPVAGHRVMARQLRHLAELSRHPHISIQIVPFEVGAYQGLNGPFVLLEFPGAEGDTVLYLENRADYVTRDDPDQIGRYIDIFQDLERHQASPSGDGSMIASAIAQLEELEDGSGISA